MSWYAESDEAKEHLKNCKKDSDTCEKCFEISEMAYAMQQYGKAIPHPLTEYVLKKFNGIKISKQGE
tara:strand:+ start:1010 stop:1210 length:201 start_codon:yes stop_codon:yes gene_type:complete